MSIITMSTRERDVVRIALIEAQTENVRTTLNVLMDWLQRPCAATLATADESLRAARELDRVLPLLTTGGETP